MSESISHEQTIAEQRLMQMHAPEYYTYDSPRVCLLQLQKVETFSEETEAQRRALLDFLYWDHEDYYELNEETPPEGVDPTADVLVCGIGGCTLRIFQAEDGSSIQRGECKASGYCLKEKFEAVRATETVEEGQALYREILDTCDGFRGANFCPNLNCGLCAGVNEDAVSGTDGDCPKNPDQLEF